MQYFFPLIPEMSLSKVSSPDWLNLFSHDSVAEEEFKLLIFTSELSKRQAHTLAFDCKSNSVDGTLFFPPCIQ